MKANERGGYISTHYGFETSKVFHIDIQMEMDFLRIVLCSDRGRVDDFVVPSRDECPYHLGSENS
jgi:hypothetical protein